MWGRSGKRFVLPLYLFPIVLGLCGLLFARQVTSPFLQLMVILFSLGAPLFAVGHLLARVRLGGFQRVALIAGVVMLVIGAMGKAVSVGDEFQDIPEVSPFVWEISQYIGLASLILGLVTVLLILVWREEEIGEIDQQFRFLSGHMSEGFILTGPDGVVRLVNKAFLALTGLREDEVVGKNTRDLAIRFDLEPMFPHIERRSSGLASEYSVPWRHNGNVRQLWFNGTPIFDHQGRYAGALATVRDVTHQHQMADRLERYTRGLQELVEDRTQQLRRNEDRLRALLLHMNEGFVTVDSSYRIQFANECIGRILAQPTASLNNRDFFEYVEPAERGKVLELFRRADAESDDGMQQEVRLIRMGGQPLSVMISIALIDQTPDERARYSLVITDITALKDMQAELEARARELEEVNSDLRMLDRAKDAFLSNVSHELRTPLSTIRGYVEMLDSPSEGQLPPQHHAALSVMRRNVERLGTLIDEIIEFSRMEIRGIQLQKSLFNTGSVVRECCESARPHALAKDITLHAGTPEVPVFVWGDRKRISQVLTILLSNAVKFTRQGGHIQIAVAADAEGTLRFTVQDTGIGIDPRYHRRIFDKFFQVDSSLARRYEGAGIGLSIAKNITEAHGGHIELGSVPGKGSTFSVVLPQMAFIHNGHAFADDGLTGKSILLIADNTEFSEAVVGVLRKLGASVDLEPTGFGGARRANEAHFDVLLIDDGMQDIGGRSLLARIRENDHGGEIPVVLFSGAQNATSLEMASDAALQILKKPFSPQSLHHAILQVLEHPVATGAETVEPVAQPSEAVVLIVATDPELMDWLFTALSRRRVPSLVSGDPATALAHLTDRNVRAVLLDIDIANEVPEDLVQLYRQETTAQQVPLYLMTGLAPDRWRQDGVMGVFRKPFGIREIMECLAQPDAETATVN